ncbi:MAG: YncE family protein [Ktedonobacteraceae bacterium]
MADISKTSSDSKSSGFSRIFVWVMGILSFGLLVYLLAHVVYQLVVPPPAQKLLFVQDILLPSGLANNAQEASSLKPGVELPFDGFDFQAYDPPSHRLFLAHTGPNPDLMTLAHTKFDPQFDGNVMVFDTKQDKIVARINVPQIAGLVIAPDLRKLYAADGTDNIVYSIDMNTLKATPIQLTLNDSPDAMSYDQVDHRVFVSVPGAPVDPNKSQNVDPKNQNITVINALTDKVVSKINLGLLPLLSGENTTTLPNAPDVPLGKPGNYPIFGHDVGHNKYDAGLQRVFVTSTILQDADSDNQLLLPPPGTGELIEIDPVNATIVKRITLPATCSTPHGMAIDEGQQVAFIACTDIDPNRNLFSNLARVDLRTMTVIPTDPAKAQLAEGPDIVVIDHPLNVLFVGCTGGISIFDEKSGEFHKLGDYVLGKGTHTIAIDEQTQEIFLPQITGGRPILRIGRYNPNGV